MPETIFVSDAVEGTFVDLDGESRVEQEEAMLSKREREKHQMKRGEEIKSEKESDSGGVWRNTGFCHRSKEYGA